MTRPVLSAEAWPAIENIEASFDIDWRAPRIDVDLPIKDKQGAVVYRFICRGGNDQAAVDALSESPPHINYVSPLMCVLNEGIKETEDSLLAEENVGPWHTRGQFQHSQLAGACGTYPQYGRVRTFRLRGFEFTLDLSDTQVNGSRAVRSKMKVNAIRKPDITSDIAEPSGYIDPQLGDCTKIMPYMPSPEEMARTRERDRERTARMLAKPE